MSKIIARSAIWGHETLCACVSESLLCSFSSSYIHTCDLLSYFAFHCYDERNTTRSDSGRKGLSPLWPLNVTAPSRGTPRPELRQELEQTPRGRLRTDLLSATFLYVLGPPAKEWYCPRWARPSHINQWFKKKATQLVTVQSDGGGSSAVVSSSQMTLVSLTLRKLTSTSAFNSFRGCGKERFILLYVVPQFLSSMFLKTLFSLSDSP